MKWQCKCGNIWEATFNNIRQGKWCPYCAGNIKKTIEDAKKFAEERGGKCLSTEYINNGTKMKWQCKCRNIWEASFNNISQGKWCPYCAGKIKKTIEDAKKLAEEKGGKCLSTEYKNANTKLKWQCKYGHIWKTSYTKIQQGGWCPHCTYFVNESYCRIVFEKLFNKKFTKIRPKWLRNNEGNGMELDGYCEKLKLAFEYNGEQHYKNKSFFFKNNKEFEKRLEMDRLKIKLCKENGIKLIIIPYNIDIKDMVNYIIKKCEILKVNIVNNLDLNLDFNLVYNDNNQCEIFYNRMKDIAKNKGGKLLSKYYTTSKDLYMFKCKCGNIWEASYSNIQQGHWCQYCAGNMKKTIEDAEKFAEEKGGKCLSTEYINNCTKMKWQCQYGHIWEANFSNIQQGNWCPYCVGNIKKTIKDAKKLAEEKGGKCLSTEYKNANTKLKWQCQHGHIWEATYGNIQQGHWCPYCAGNAKKQKMVNFR